MNLGQTNRQNNRQTDRQTDRQTNKTFTYNSATQHLTLPPSCTSQQVPIDNDLQPKSPATHSQSNTNMLTPPQLTHLFWSHYNRNHTLRLSGLCSLVNKNHSKFKFCQPGITSTHTSTTNYISILDIHNTHNSYKTTGTW